jgi:hypothetical protein
VIGGDSDNLRSRGAESEYRLSILIEPLGHLLEVGPRRGLVRLGSIGG